MYNSVVFYEKYLTPLYSYTYARENLSVSKKNINFAAFFENKTI